MEEKIVRSSLCLLFPGSARLTACTIIVFQHFTEYFQPFRYFDFHIWLVDFSPSIGHEYQKIRPAVIISPNSLLKRSNLFTCIAITSKTAKTMPGDIELAKTAKNNLFHDSVIKMQHITSYDKRRLHKYIGALENQFIEAIKKRLKEMYDL